MAQYFRYYQQHREDETWKVMPDKAGIEAELKKKQIKRASILAISAVVDESTDPEKLAYRGPFYIDIDNKADIQSSVDSTKKLVHKLEEMGVPDSAYEIHASGSKGFHVYIHQTALYNGRALRRLPKIYREMAVDLYVPGLDFKVYSGGRGNLFRVPGVMREDKKFKVPIFKAELETMTPEIYAHLTSTSRPNLVGHGMRAQDAPCSSLVQLFESARSRDKRLEKQRQKNPVSDLKLGPFASDPPQCVRDLSTYKVSSGENFNMAAYQMAVFIARSGAPGQVADSLTDMMAKMGTSSSYSNVWERRSHINGLSAYLKHQPSKGFSCSAMRAILSTSPCEGCSLYDSKAHLEEQYDVVERPDGYYAIGAKGAERRLTTFILIPQKVVISHATDNTAHTKTRVYTQMVVEKNHERVAITQIQDDEWNSRSGFMRPFTGKGDNLCITAGDQDIQNLKHYVLRDIKDVEEQEVVESIGIHRQVLNNGVRFTYVEKGMSVNKFFIPDTHLHAPKVDVEDAVFPSLQNIRRVKIGDNRHLSAIRHLLKMNEPEVIAPIFGWFMASHLKAHIFGLRSEFPLLGAWGGRGSGKTQTACMFGALHACNFFSSPPPTLTAITPFAFLTHASASNTVPRIFDEFNKSGMGASRYVKFSEYFKNLFNNSPSAKGSVTQQDKLTVAYHKPSSPTLILSEHDFEVPALRDRLYSVILREPSLRPRTEHFEKAKDGMVFLTQIAKEAVYLALEIREEWVQDELKKWTATIPIRFSDRQRFCRATIQVGISFAEKVLCERMGLDLAAEMADLRQTFRDHVDAEKMSDSGVGTTEVDALMVKLGEMVMLSANDQTNVKITPHNIRKVGGSLYVDPISAFPLLKIYTAALRDRMPLNSSGELESLLSAESYYEGKELIPDMLQSRSVIKLDLEKMRQKGINISVFS